MTYSPYYLAVDTAQLYLGNTAAQNIHADMDEAAARFADGMIFSAIGGQIPSTSIHFGKAVGLAYLLYKVQRQNGLETEKQRKLDWDIATAGLVTLNQEMVASGEISLIATENATIDGGLVGYDSYETSPINPRGKVTLGARTRGGVASSQLNDVDTTNLTFVA